MVKYAEAFAELGYQLESVRQDWSAEKPDGVCLAIWRKELTPRNRLPGIDLWELHPDGGDWASKPGHKKRTGHLATAMEKFDGRVDVILVQGEPGSSSGGAEPWLSDKRRGSFWRVTEFDPDSGFFKAEVTPPARS